MDGFGRFGNTGVACQHQNHQVCERETLYPIAASRFRCPSPGDKWNSEAQAMNLVLGYTVSPINPQYTEPCTFGVCLRLNFTGADQVPGTKKVWPAHRREGSDNFEEGTRGGIWEIE